ncbi:MAG: hypothetical protein JWN82_208 [Candidatus Saccharibacteria bacterium]|nr:hypothetical protein [Candidatus Saccharibacteria bacterium]
MQYIFHEPTDYIFKDRDGHDGKSFGTNSKTSGHLIIECTDKLTVALTQNEVEFNYYVIAGNGYFILNDEKQAVSTGDLVVIPPKTKYTFGGQLKMLLIQTSPWSADQETVERL